MAIPAELARPWIDTTEFTRTRGRQTGCWPIASLPRLTDLLSDAQGDVEWALEGARNARPDGGHDAHLSLEFKGQVRMTCVRCLEPVQTSIADCRRFRLVVAESVAEREDQQSEGVDLLVASARFDVIDLLEDEIIMALPLAPRHATCQPPPGATVVPEGTTEQSAASGSPESVEPQAGIRPNPFSVLAQIRSRPADDRDED